VEGNIDAYDAVSSVSGELMHVLLGKPARGSFRRCGSDLAESCLVGGAQLSEVGGHMSRLSRKSFISSTTTPCPLTTDDTILRVSQ
jgi:hypothetical protein